MSLNKQRGNMYDWITHTWNPIAGDCPHNCSYCYIKAMPIYPVGAFRLRERYLKNDCLGSGRAIFVGSSTDMWAAAVSRDWITAILRRCGEFDNEYLFQTKNPSKFGGFKFPDKTTLGITLESNRDYGLSAAPGPTTRANVFAFPSHFAKMVSIEPIVDFDLDIFADWLRAVAPSFVSIGADSKRHNLPEPSGDKVKSLIATLEKFTVVKTKKNLARLLR